MGPLGVESGEETGSVRALAEVRRDRWIVAAAAGWNVGWNPSGCGHVGHRDDAPSPAASPLSSLSEMIVRFHHPQAPPPPHSTRSEAIFESIDR